MFDHDRVPSEGSEVKKGWGHLLQGFRKNMRVTFVRRVEHTSRVSEYLSSGDTNPKITSFGRRKIVYGMKFRILAAFMIILDAISIGYQADESLRLGYEQHTSSVASSPALSPEAWQAIEACFVAYYTLEVTLRCLAEHLTFLSGRDRWWNLFDLLSVISSIVGAILSEDRGSKIIRLLRMTRFLRVLRAVRFSGSLRAMMFSLTSSLEPLFWALCVMLVVMYFFTVVLVTEIADLLERTAASSDSRPDVGAFLPYYKSSLDTVLYLFMSITGGIDWQMMAVPLVDVNPILMCVFVMYIFFMVFGVLNVVVGIFVEKAKNKAERDREMLTEKGLEHEKEVIQRLRDIFNEADTDGDNAVSWEEFSEYIADSQVAAFFNSLGLDVHVAQALFLLLDVDGSNEVNVDEFVHGCLRLRGGARSIDVNMLLYQSEKLQHQFMDHMKSVGGELSRLAGALNLPPDEVVAAKPNKASARKPPMGLAALSPNLLSVGHACEAGSAVARASKGSRASQVIQSVGIRELALRSSMASTNTRLQGP